jgi:hypothetical protein
MRRVHGATSSLFACDQPHPRALLLYPSSQRPSFFSLLENIVAPNICYQYFVDRSSKQQGSWPSVGECNSCGRGGESCDVGKSDADRYGRYQAKLKTAPLLTQAITTGVRIPLKYCRLRNASLNTLIEHLDYTNYTKQHTAAAMRRARLQDEN